MSHSVVKEAASALRDNRYLAVYLSRNHEFQIRPAVSEDRALQKIPHGVLVAQTWMIIVRHSDQWMVVDEQFYCLTDRAVDQVATWAGEKWALERAMKRHPAGKKRRRLKLVTA